MNSPEKCLPASRPTATTQMTTAERTQKKGIGDVAWPSSFFAPFSFLSAAKVLLFFRNAGQETRCCAFAVQGTRRTEDGPERLFSVSSVPSAADSTVDDRVRDRRSRMTLGDERGLLGEWMDGRPADQASTGRESTDRATADCFALFAMTCVEAQPGHTAALRPGAGNALFISWRGAKHSLPLRRQGERSAPASPQDLRNAVPRYRIETAAWRRLGQQAAVPWRIVLLWL